MSKQVTNSGVAGFNAIYLGLTQSIVTSNVSQSISFSPPSTMLRIFCTADCYVAIGPSAVATTASAYMPAGVVDYVGMLPGDSISVLQVSSSGTCYVTAGA